MARLPQLSGREVISALQREGFVVDRITGSHHIMVKQGHRFNVSVPIHGSKPVNPFTLKNILKQAMISHERFLELCGKQN